MMKHLLTLALALASCTTNATAPTQEPDQRSALAVGAAMKPRFMHQGELRAMKREGP